MICRKCLDKIYRDDENIKQFRKRKEVNEELDKEWKEKELVVEQNKE